MQEIERVELEPESVAAFLERAKRALQDDDYRYLEGIVKTLAYLTELLERKETTVRQLRKLLFGFRSEKLKKILGDAEDASPGEAEAAQLEEDTGELPGEDKGEAPPDTQGESGGNTGEEAGEKQKKPKRKGHGRNGADDYTGAERILVEHECLKPGDPCPVPGCTGRVYRSLPEKIVRIKGRAPIAAIVYELERLRCNLCLQVFKAPRPAAAGPEKYEETAASMTALLRYGTGMPFHRLEGLQKNFGIPLAASTQWDIVLRPVKKVLPAYQALFFEAAQGDVIYVDDTPVKILALMKKRKEGKGDDG